MADFNDALRALNALLKDVGGADGIVPAVVRPAEQAVEAALGRTTATQASSGGSVTRSVLGTLGSGLLGGGIAGSIAGGTSEKSTLGSVLGFLGKGFGLAPAISAIFKLFGGGGSEEPVALPKYVAPPSLQLSAANTAAAGTGLAFEPVRYASGNLAASTVAPVREASTPTQVTVQVNAMDSRSFLDHSDDIARAVREAILNMHPLTDVVSEL